MKLFWLFSFFLISHNAVAQTPATEYFICKGSAAKIIIPGVPFSQADLDNDINAKWSPRAGLKVDNCLTCNDEPTRCFQPRAAPTSSTTYTITVRGITYSVRVLVATKFEVQPLSSDFTAGKEGCVFTASRPDILVRKRNGIAESVSQYYTNLQTQNRRVRIKAVLQPAQDFVGKTIYFNSIDPPDLSRYGNNCTVLCQPLNGGCALDNLDDAIMSGKFTAITNTDLKRGLTNLGTAPAVLQQRSLGGDVAIAEIDLVITDQYQGDNYQVLAGLYKNNDNTLDASRSCIGKSAILVAWKRYYVEIDNMYVKGGTIMYKIDTNGDGNTDRFEVDNVDGLTIGTRITLIRKDNTNIDNIIKRIYSNTEGNSFYIDVNECDVSTRDGFKIVGNDDVLPIGEGDLNGYFSDAFGSRIDGADNSSFTELITGIKFSSVVPNVKTFACINDADRDVYVRQNINRINTIPVISFARHWFEGEDPATTTFTEGSSNIRHITIINKMTRPSPILPIVAGFTAKSIYQRNAQIVVQNTFYNTENGDGTGRIISFRDFSIGERHKVTIHEMGHSLGLADLTRPNDPSFIISPIPFHVDSRSCAETPPQVCPTNQEDVCLMSYCGTRTWSTIKVGFDAQCYWRLRSEYND